MSQKIFFLDHQERPETSLPEIITGLFLLPKSEYFVNTNGKKKKLTSPTQHLS